jgi:nucleotide-binding universal stress UspA family protein
MYKHILVPLDGSTISEESLLEARLLLEKGAQIDLVTVIDTPEVIAQGFSLESGVVLNDVATQEQMVNWANSYLEEVAARLTKDGFVAMPFVEMGEPAKNIADRALRSKVDAILITTHGRSGVSRWLFGSVTNKVLNIAPCPVIVVPSQEKLRLLERTSPEAFYG